MDMGRGLASEHGEGRAFLEEVDWGWGVCRIIRGLGWLKRLGRVLRGGLARGLYISMGPRERGCSVVARNIVHFLRSVSS